jgi:site-specific recombinase XerC
MLVLGRLATLDSRGGPIIIHEHGSAPGRKAPIRVHHLKLIVRQIPANPVGLRDKALLLVGFAGAFRGSELVAIDRSHLEFVREGVKVVLHSPSKAAAEIVGIPYGRHPETCPVRALLTWPELRATRRRRAGFRPFDRWGHVRQNRLTDEWVAKVVKRYVQSIGMDPDQFASHSLRAGLATSAAPPERPSAA